MKMLFFPGREAVEAARRDGEPLLLLVSVDGETAVIAPADEAVEHHILLDRAGKAGLIEGDSRDIDRYFRAVVDEEGADWTFVCPSKLLDPDGPRTGDYLTRTDRHIPINEDGNSYVSYDDLAIAMVDFGQNGSFKRQLVAVASRRGGPQA